MMALYKLYVACVLLCAVHSVHSVQITGTIKNIGTLPSKVEVSEYVNGDNWNNTVYIKLNRLVGAATLPTLTFTNFKSINTMYLTNISLEHVPVFENTRCREIHITGNQIKSVLANAFRGPRPYRLDLSNNEIQSMADRSINVDASLVTLSCNNLGVFSQSWFEKPGRILLLDLTGNRIEYIEDQAFTQMTKLHALKLSYNHITRIGSEAFGSEIRELHLQFNNIVELTPRMFAHREKTVSYLYLHHNLLSFLPEALLLKLKPKHISLGGNPWQCQCLRDIERWLRELNSVRFHIHSRRDEPVCVVPRNFVNVCVLAVDTELQQTFARRLSPVSECCSTPCKPCSSREDLVRLI